MSLYCVVCKNGEMTFEAKELILALPIDVTLNNRFPSEDLTSDLYNLEVFKKGTRAECQAYINTNIPSHLRHYFSIEPVDEDAMRLI
ncbi:MAG: hypothetical protein ACOX39_00070 [Arcobacteraceae bacterium]